MSDKPQPVSFPELMTREFPESSWLVEGLVPLGGITALSGESGSYKTWAMLSLAVAVATGEPLFGHFPTTQNKVLFVNQEISERLLQERVRSLTNATELPLCFLSHQGFQLEPRAIQGLISTCHEESVETVIFDSLIRIHGKDENDAGQMSGVSRNLKLFNAAELTVLFTHHNRKKGLNNGGAEAMRGSTEVRAAVNSHLAVEKKGKGNFVINQTKLWEAEETPDFRVSVDVAADESVRLNYAGSVDRPERRGQVGEAIVSLLAQEGRPMLQKEISDGVKDVGGDKMVSEVLSGLTESGTLRLEKGERNAHLYSLAESPTQTETEPAKSKPQNGSPI